MNSAVDSTIAFGSAAEPAGVLPLGIATLHYGYNEGAILQAGALAALLSEEIPETPVRIVDQRYPGKQKVYDRNPTSRTQALQDAIDHWLPLSTRRTESEGQRELRDLLNSEYSGIVVGSDVVWSLRYKRRFRRFLGRGILPHQPDPFFTAFPNFYWPGPDVVIPKMSWAASVGTLEFADVPLRHRRAMRDTLRAFDLLSVRDERTLQFIERLDPSLLQRTELMPDPTLAKSILDTARDDDLKEKLVQLGVDFSRPRLGVVCPDHPAVRESVTLLRDQGFQIVSITTANSFSDVELFNVGLHPLEWARVFHFMDCCLIERMHAAIFCLLNRTPFVVLDQYVTKRESDTKVLSLLRQFGLERHRLVKDLVTAAELTAALTEIRTDGWDWSQIHAVIRMGQERARTFVAKYRQQFCSRVERV